MNWQDTSSATSADDRPSGNTHNPGGTHPLNAMIFLTMVVTDMLSMVTRGALEWERTLFREESR
ncbi:MAG: hypothetical protein ACRDP6_38685 [Actinoallomurus sp.]